MLRSLTRLSPRSASRQYAASQEKNINDELPIPEHYGWTPETFKGMDAWEIQFHMKSDMILSEVYVAL